MIPITTPERYLSGTAGLNIPCPDGTDGDWRMRAVLTSEGKKLELAGEGEGAIVNLNPWLGTSGVHECGEVLRSHGIDVSGEVFAGSHSRSLLDKVVSLALEGNDVPWIAEFMVANDFLPGHQINHLDDLISRCDPAMPGFDALTEWRTKTYHWSPLQAAVGNSLLPYFMYMGKVELDESKALHLYKHRDTKRYLNIDDEGLFYLYDSESYHEVSHEAALAKVFS